MYVIRTEFLFLFPHELFAVFIHFCLEFMICLQVHLFSTNDGHDDR